MTAPAPYIVDVKCPVGPRELLERLTFKRDPEEFRPFVDNDNLMNLKCSFCTRQARKSDPSVLRIIHQYNFIGELVTSSVEYR